MLAFRPCLAAVALALTLLLGPSPVSAADDPLVDPEASVVADLVVVAPAEGPAWWKASKGDSVVWILGLPPGRTPAGLTWSDRPLNRRLKGARLLLAPYTEWSGWRKGDAARAAVLPEPLAGQVRQAFAAVGKPMRRGRPPTIGSAMALRYAYYDRNRLTHDTHGEIYRAARRAKVPVVTAARYNHYWNPTRLTAADPAVRACIEGILQEVATPAAKSREASAAWAAGDVRGAIAAAPRGVGWTCRSFWPGHWERTITFQTNAIAQALEAPGKVLAVAHIGHLVAEDGILERLRARGYTIADPAAPLAEEEGAA